MREGRSEKAERKHTCGLNEIACESAHTQAASKYSRTYDELDIMNASV